MSKIRIVFILVVSGCLGELIWSDIVHGFKEMIWADWLASGIGLTACVVYCLYVRRKRAKGLPNDS